jgi:site-specific DNA recombinase
VNTNDNPGRGQTAALGCGQGEAPAPDGSDGLFGSNSGGFTVPRANQYADAPESRNNAAPRPRKHDRSAEKHDSRPRAVGYCRVSTDGQATEGVSLDAQRARIAAWSDANGYRLADVFTDAGLSGKRADNRPGLQAALVDVCRSGGALVVYSLSRLARSTRDAIAIAERLDKAGADMVSLTEKIDTTTAAGKMVFRLLAVLNEFERDLASERTRAALAHKRTRNERTGGVPFGWRLVDPTARKKDALMVEVPDEQAALACIGEWRAAGRTLREIAAQLTADGVPTKKLRGAWTHQAVGKIVARLPIDAMI